MAQIGIIGMGKWGKNLIREFSSVTNVSICVTTGNQENIIWLKKNFPKTKHSKNIKDIIENKKITAVVVATPIKTHYKFIKQILDSGKHVFVEKPMTQTISQADELIKIAKNKKLCLAVGHVFLHSQIFQHIKKIHSNERILFLDFNWKKFGTFKENIFENLLTHELSINLELFGIPKKFNIINYSSKIIDADLIYVKLYYNKTRKSIIHINRVSPFKKKTVTIVTTKNIYVWDYDKLFKLDKKTNSYKIYFQSTKTPLFLECKQFISSISKNNFSYDSPIMAKNITDLIFKLLKGKTSKI